jgi:hypothetical protein
MVGLGKCTLQRQRVVHRRPRLEGDKRFHAHLFLSGPVRASRAAARAVGGRGARRASSRQPAPPYRTNGLRPRLGGPRAGGPGPRGGRRSKRPAGSARVSGELSTAGRKSGSLAALDCTPRSRNAAAKRNRFLAAVTVCRPRCSSSGTGSSGPHVEKRHVFCGRCVWCVAPVPTTRRAARPGTRAARYASRIACVAAKTFTVSG